MTDTKTPSPSDAEIVALLGDPKYSTIGAVREAVARWGQPMAVAGGEPVAWRSAVLDLIDDCPGLSLEQDRWLSRRVKELDFPSAPPPQAVREPQCWCLTCRPMRLDDPHSIRMALCPTCGNKRCPKANDHRNACTHSNEPGQPGSAYPDGITANSGKGDGNADT